MASGVPVVGSRAGEIPYVIGQSGLTFPAGDPVELANVLARVRDEPAVAAGLAEAGTARAARFSWDRIAADLDAEWRALASLRKELAATRRSGKVARASVNPQVGGWSGR